MKEKASNRQTNRQKDIKDRKILSQERYKDKQIITEEFLVKQTERHMYRQTDKKGL